MGIALGINMGLISIGNSHGNRHWELNWRGVELSELNWLELNCPSWIDVERLVNSWNISQDLSILMNHFCIPGLKLLKLEFVTSRIREKVFVFVTALILLVILLLNFVSVATRNESLYKFLYNEYHWTTWFLCFLLFICSETIQTLDTMMNCTFNLSTVYFGCVGIQFWLKQIW